MTRSAKVAQQRRQLARRKDRIHKYVETIVELNQLIADANARGDTKEASRIKVRVRTLRQQIRYMGGEDL